MKIVTTNGCMDVLHMAHVRLLKKARALGDKLIVLINSDESIRRLKGPDRPINNQNDRRDILLALKYVDEVIIQHEDTPLKILNKIRPDIHVKGGSYVKEKVDAERKLVESWGGKVVLMPMEKGYSSSNTINKGKFVRFKTSRGYVSFKKEAKRK